MEILDLRHFSSVDLRPLLDDETQVWSRLLSWDYSSSSDMILRYVDAKILPGYAAIDRGRIFGYAFFVYEGSKGVIGDLFVADEGPAPDRRQIEARLLAHVIETLQQSPGIHRVEAQLLVHDAGALARPFLDQGFRRHPRLFMAMPLSRPARPAPSIYPDFEVRRVAGERLPVRSCRDHGGLSWTRRLGHQRPVPYPERIPALSEQHRALSRVRPVRCGVCRSS